MNLPPSSDAAPPAPAPTTESADVPFRRTIKTYVLRAGRTTTGQARAYETLGDRFLLPYRAEPIDLPATFGREAPTVLEIGFGMGEATAHIAALLPDAAST